MAEETIENDSTIADVVTKLKKPQEYVRRVCEHMWDCKQQFGSATVRIGVMGRGRAPNYRIECPGKDEDVPANFAVYNGLGRKEIRELGMVDLETLFAPAPAPPEPKHLLQYDHWSTRSMSLDEIQVLLGKLRRRK